MLDQKKRTNWLIRITLHRSLRKLCVTREVPIVRTFGQNQKEDNPPIDVVIGRRAPETLQLQREHFPNLIG